MLYCMLLMGVGLEFFWQDLKRLDFKDFFWVDVYNVFIVDMELVKLDSCFIVKVQNWEIFNLNKIYLREIKLREKNLLI